jgi:hypothetical protein
MIVLLNSATDESAWLPADLRYWTDLQPMPAKHVQSGCRQPVRMHQLLLYGCHAVMHQLLLVPQPGEDLQSVPLVGKSIGFTGYRASATVLDVLRMSIKKSTILNRYLLLVLIIFVLINQ